MVSSVTTLVVELTISFDTRWWDPAGLIPRTTIKQMKPRPLGCDPALANETRFSHPPALAFSFLKRQQLIITEIVPRENTHRDTTPRAARNSSRGRAECREAEDSRGTYIDGLATDVDR